MSLHRTRAAEMSLAPLDATSPNVALRDCRGLPSFAYAVVRRDEVHGNVRVAALRHAGFRRGQTSGGSDGTAMEAIEEDRPRPHRSVPRRPGGRRLPWTAYYGTRVFDAVRQSCASRPGGADMGPAVLLARDSLPPRGHDFPMVDERERSNFRHRPLVHYRTHGVP